jgi:hypothetical protein
MATRILGPTGSRARRTRAPLLLMALMGLIFGVMIGGGGFASAAKPSGPSVVDYSQCTDGTANDDFKGCISYINGILNNNNSTYHENEVTPQRLIMDFPASNSATHTIDLRWLVRKADAHAYDSLATWNFTQKDADPCQGLTGQTKNACEGSNGTGGTEADFDVPADDLQVASPCNDPNTTANATTSNHQLADQQFEMFGLGATGGIDSFVYNPNTVLDSEGLYQLGTLTFHFSSAANGRAYLYFGGHLARGENGWGTDCGAGSINGGPYHIKVDALDGGSVGSRDNQIMSGAVLPLQTPTMTTTPSADPTTNVDLSDTMDLGNTAAQGTADFYLYSDSLCATTPLDSDLNVAVVNGVATSKTIQELDVSGDTTWYWSVHYDGDVANNFAPADSTCKESASVVVATTSVVTDPVS